MPMVWRRDHHRINIFSVEDLSIILVRVWFFILCLFCFLDVCAEDIRIDVGERGEIRELK